MNIDAVIALAISQIGVKESPPGSNRVKYCTWYGMVGPWCAMFTSWLFHEAGCPLPVIQPGAPSGAAYCPFVEAYARKHSQWHNKPQRGDLALFHFGKNLAVHIGIVESVGRGGAFTCIEGNTSAASNDNGGAVMRRTRYVKQCRGFYRPLLSPAKTGKDAYYRLIKLTDPYMSGGDIAAWQKQANWFKYGLEVDGVYGEASEKACKQFQATRKLDVDGVIGPQTWAETFRPLT